MKVKRRVKRFSDFDLEKEIFLFKCVADKVAFEKGLRVDQVSRVDIDIHLRTLESVSFILRSCPVLDVSISMGITVNKSDLHLVNGILPYISPFQA